MAVLKLLRLYRTLLHTFLQIAEKLFDIIKQQHLKDIGQLEQDLVFGDAGTKELIDFFRTCRVIINRTITNEMCCLVIPFILDSLLFAVSIFCVHSVSSTRT